MKQILLTTFVLNISAVSFSQQTNQFKLIDNYVKEAIKTNQIPGLAIGVIKDGKVILSNITVQKIWKMLKSKSKFNVQDIFYFKINDRCWRFSTD
jgi:predicted oxidoreductase